MKNLNILAIATLIGLAGCSSVPEPETDMGKHLVELERLKSEMLAIQQAKKQNENEEYIDQLPDWVEAPPPADSEGFYGVGIGQSKVLNHARKAARLEASNELAKMSKQEISGSERAFDQGNADGDVLSQTTFLIDSILDSVPVVGFETVEQKITSINGKFIVYSLMKLPYDQFNKVLQQQKAASQDKRIQAQFDDLERRLKDRRKERELQQDNAHKREMESLEARSKLLSQQEGGDAKKETVGATTESKSE